MKVKVIVIMLFVFLSCSNKGKMVAVEMQALEGIVNEYQSDTLLYKGNCECNYNTGYVGESLKSATYEFSLHNVKSMRKEQDGHVTVEIISPSFVKVEMFPEEYEEQEHQAMIERRKNKFSFPLGELHQLIYNSKSTNTSKKQLYSVEPLLKRNISPWKEKEKL